VERSQFERWVRQIYATEEEEISRSECFDLVFFTADTALTERLFQAGQFLVR